MGRNETTGRESLAAGILLCGLLGSCGGAATDDEQAPLRPRLPVPENADASSLVKIGAVERLCERVRTGNALPVTANALGGQRLEWRTEVVELERDRLLVGVGSVRVAVTVDAETVNYRPGDRVVVRGVIAMIDTIEAVVSLQPDAEISAMPPR